MLMRFLAPCWLHFHPDTITLTDALVVAVALASAAVLSAVQSHLS